VTVRAPKGFGGDVKPHGTTETAADAEAAAIHLSSFNIGKSQAIIIFASGRRTPAFKTEAEFSLATRG
jgi:hypothetical protein